MKTTMTTDHLYENPDYIQGQIAALQALILGLAQNQSKESFKIQSLERLEILKTTLLSSPVSDARLEAVDTCIEWVQHITA